MNDFQVPACEIKKIAEF